jgi:hypothetical protein
VAGKRGGGVNDRELLARLERYEQEERLAQQVVREDGDAPELVAKAEELIARLHRMRDLLLGLDDL